VKKTWPLRPVKPHFISTIGQRPHYVASAVDVLREGLYHFLYDVSRTAEVYSMCWFLDSGNFRLLFGGNKQNACSFGSLS
jgi:hypothetical protein